MSGSVLIIGGGVAGCAAALELAEAGTQVVLVDSRATIGGKLASILEKDAQETTMPPKFPSLTTVASHPNIEIFPLTDVTEVSANRAVLMWRFASVNGL